MLRSFYACSNVGLPFYLGCASGCRARNYLHCELGLRHVECFYPGNPWGHSHVDLEPNRCSSYSYLGGAGLSEHAFRLVHAHFKRQLLVRVQPNRPLPLLLQHSYIDDCGYLHSRRYVNIVPPYYFYICLILSLKLALFGCFSYNTSSTCPSPARSSNGISSKWVHSNYNADE